MQNVWPCVLPFLWGKVTHYSITYSSAASARSTSAAVNCPCYDLLSSSCASLSSSVWSSPAWLTRSVLLSVSCCSSTRFLHGVSSAFTRSQLIFHYKKKSKVSAVSVCCFLCNFTFNLSFSRLLLIFVILQLSVFVLGLRHPTYNKIRCG